MQERGQQLVEIIEEELAHMTQVLLLDQLHLQQYEEIRIQGQEIRQFSVLVKQ